MIIHFFLFRPQTVDPGHDMHPGHNMYPKHVHPGHNMYLRHDMHPGHDMYLRHDILSPGQCGSASAPADYPQSSAEAFLYKPSAYCH